MVNFRTFLKRTGALISVLVVLFCCALPASAADVGYSWYMPFQFTDLVALYGSSKDSYHSIPFPVSRSWPSSVYDDQLIATKISASNSSGIYLDYDVSDEYEDIYGLEFAAKQLFIPLTVLSSSSFTVSLKNGSATARAVLYLSFDYCVVAEDASGNDYVAKRVNFSRLDLNSYGTGYSSVNIADYVYDLVVANDSSPSSVVCLENFKVSVESNDPISGFTMYQPAMDVIGSPYGWINGSDLPIQDVVVDPSDPVEVDFVDWLGVAIGGFLDFELWPGMSLNELLWVCLVIGILFTFMKFVV